MSAKKQTNPDQAAPKAGPAAEPDAASKPDPENKTSKTVKAPALIKALQVVSKRDSFRRGGHVFGKSPTTIKMSALTTEQIKLIKDEPLLLVSEIEVEDDAQPAAEGASAE